MARVVVVGAGAGGLAVAAWLGAKGHAVTVVERHEHVGGKLRTLHQDGFAFDVGPSLFTLPAVYRHLFRRTGRPLEDEIGLVETEPGFRYQFADGSLLRLPGASVGRTTAAIREQLGAGAAGRWRSLMDRAAEVWRLTRDDVLGTAIDSPRQLLSLSRPGALRAVAPWRHLHGLARSVGDPRLTAVLDRYATYSGSDPRKAPGALVTIPFVEQTFGLWHIAGGLGTLAGALRARAEKAGATFRLGSAVIRIEHTPAGVRGVALADGDRLDADIVVADVDARLMPALLGLPDRRRGRAHSYSGFAILAAVQGPSDGLHHHNVWFPRRYRGEFDDLAAGRPVRDPAIYVCRPDDPAMAPSGDEAWFILVNAPRHGRGRVAVDWHEPGVADRYADAVLAMLAERGTDIRDRIRWRIVQTPADLGARDGTGDGAIYGYPAHGAFSVLRRAPNVDPIPGLFRVGGTAHPGGGLPLVGMGAEIVAEHIGRARSRR